MPLVSTTQSLAHKSPYSYFKVNPERLIKNYSLKESNQAYTFPLKMELLQFWKASTCVATLQQELSSPCRRQSGQEGQCVPQDYRTVWSGGEDYHHHHSPGPTEMQSISMLKARYCAQKYVQVSWKYSVLLEGGS